MTLPTPLTEIVTALQPQAASLTPTSTLDEIGLDSLDRIRLAAALESAYGIVIPDAVLADVHQLGDLTAILDTHPPAKGPSLIVADRIPAPREAPRQLPPAVVHPSAELGEGTHIGLGSQVWHRVQLASGVHIGKQCTLGTGVHLGTGTRVGNRVKMQNLAQVFGADIHDDVMLAPGVLILEDPAPRAVTPAGTPRTPADWTARPVTVCRGATIGAGAILLPGVRIGAHALIAAGAVVDHDVPPHALIAGNPCCQIGWACLCGHRLTSDACHRCHTRYRRDTIHSM